MHFLYYLLNISTDKIVIGKKCCHFDTKIVNVFFRMKPLLASIIYLTIQNFQIVKTAMQFIAYDSMI